MKKIIIFALCFAIILPITVNASFTDVEPGHWAEQYIIDLTENGIISGMGDGTFAPNATLTKGQFLKLILEASFFEIAEKIDFNEVQTDFNHWAAPYVKVAEDYSLIEQGDITLENIDLPINRIDVVKILSMADFYIKNNEQEKGKNIEFTDVSDLSTTEIDLLNHAVTKGIINGYPDGTFLPYNNLTRAEVSKIIAVYMGIS